MEGGYIGNEQVQLKILYKIPLPNCLKLPFTIPNLVKNFVLISSLTMIEDNVFSFVASEI